MSSLPKAYVRIAQGMTGYWGTYPPDKVLEPGVIGRVLDGRFATEGHLNQLPGYDPAIHSVLEQGRHDPVSVWTTDHVNLEMLGAHASAPAGAATATIQMRFGGANEAAIICNGNSYRSFVNLRKVKDLMMQLLDQKLWDREWCIITEVLVTRMAWICFSTDKGQAADFNVSGPLIPGSDPLGILKAAGGHLDLVASSANSQAAGYSTTLPSGGTPLFQALRIRREWFNPAVSKPQYLKGGDEAFEVPSFSED